jgi:hypothetical protein
VPFGGTGQWDCPEFNETESPAQRQHFDARAPHTTSGAERVEAGRYSFTITGSPMLTVLKYHSASAGFRLMQPWLTFSRPSDWTAHGAECTNRPRLLIRVA